MPKLNARFQALRKEADWSTAELAQMLGLTDGSLRNVESGREPMGDRRIHRAARLLTAQLKRPVSYDELVAEGDGTPDKPPVQPKPKPKTPGRKDRGGKGPRRDESELGAA